MNEFLNKKWYEDVMKQTEAFDGENFPDWKFKLRNNILTYGGQEIPPWMPPPRRPRRSSRAATPRQ